MKKPKIDYRFTENDIDALLVSLPLIDVFEADTEEQQELNTALSITAANKLANRLSNISPNEFRIMYVSACIAKEYLSGHLSLDIDDDMKADLRKHFFTYNKLVSTFSPVLDGLNS